MSLIIFSGGSVENFTFQNPSTTFVVTEKCLCTTSMRIEAQNFILLSSLPATAKISLKIAQNFFSLKEAEIPQGIEWEVSPKCSGIGDREWLQEELKSLGIQLQKNAGRWSLILNLEEENTLSLLSSDC